MSTIKTIKSTTTTKKNDGIKSISLKFLQILLFTSSIYIYLELVGFSDKVDINSKIKSTLSPIPIPEEDKIVNYLNEESNISNIEIYKWFLGIILFSIGWSIGTFKVLSNILLGFFTFFSIQQFIQHLPLNNYEEFLNSFSLTIGEKMQLNNQLSKELVKEQFLYFLPYLGDNFTIEIIATQCCLILFFSFLGFNIYLADKFWLLKTVIVDWILALILIVAFSITDLLNKESRVFLVLSYILGSNVIGFGTIKLLEYFWNLSSKLDSTTTIIKKTTTTTTTTTTNTNLNTNTNSNNLKSKKSLDDSIEFDTDNNFNNNDQQQQQEEEEEEHFITQSIEGEVNNSTSPTTTDVTPITTQVEEEEEIKIDNTDYNKLSESELDAILSEPIKEDQVQTRNLAYHKSTRFINNLVAPENINQRISAKEFVGVIILWVYAMSNFIIENYSSYSDANILVFIGFSGTILSYLSTISAKRLTNKDPSKREC